MAKEIIEYPDFDISGSNKGRTILLLHGTGVTRKMWIPQMVTLSYRYRVIAPDLLGHGRKKNEVFTFEKAVEELKNLITDNKYGKVLVVGFSLGGYLASEFVSQYSDMTNGLVLVGSSATPKGFITLPYHLLALLYRFISYRWLARREARLWRIKYRPEIAEPVISAGFYHCVIPHLEKEIGGKTFLPFLKEYNKPVLIINGEKDHIFRNNERLYHDSIAYLKLVVIERTGHMCNVDKPDEFNKYLIEFADSLRWID